MTASLHANEDLISRATAHATCELRVVVVMTRVVVVLTLCCCADSCCCGAQFRIVVDGEEGEIDSVEAYIETVNTLEM